METIDKLKLKNLALNCYSCLKENGKKINYMAYIQSMKNNECNDAINRIFGKIDIKRIIDFINNIPCISTTRKEFYNSILNYRYEIIQDVYNKLNEN